MKKFFVIMLAAAAWVALSAPAWASGEPGPKFTVGGRMLTDIGYHTLSKELTKNGSEDVTSAFINMAAHSNLRAQLASADRSFGGLVELGLLSKVGGKQATSLRYAYGWWKVGNCRLVAGHTDGWVGTLIHAPKQYLGVSESAKLLLANWGYTYSARAPQVRFEWMSGNYGFSLAAVQPGSELLPRALLKLGDPYATLPRFDIAAQIKAGGFWAQPGFGWSQLKAADSEGSATAWIAILPMKYTVGPFTAKAEVHYGQNKDMEWSGELIGALRTLPRSMPCYSQDEFVDTKELGGFLALEYKFSPALEVTAGYGFAKLSNDTWKDKEGWKDDNYTRQAYFVALPCYLSKNFSLQPEFNYFDYGDAKNGNSSGNEWMLGLQVRFVF